MIIQDLFESPQLCPECGGISFSDLILAEKKDACYYKVKASAKVWPSAYASGRLVQCRKKGAANYGKSKNEGVAEGDFDKWGGEIKTPPANYKKNLKQPTSPAKLAKQQAANRQRNQQKVVAEGGILKSIKRGLQGWDKNAVGPSGEKLGNPRDIVNRAKAMDTDTAKKVRAGLDAALDHSPAGLQKRILDRKLKGVAEGSSDNLRANVLDVLLTIYHGAVNDEDMTDTIDSELGEYFAAVEASNDAKLQKVYAYVRDLADADLDIQASGTLKAMKKLMGPTYTPPPPSAAPNDTAVRDLAGNFAAAMGSHGIKAHPDWKKKDKGVAEGSLNEFAPGKGGGNDYLRELASAWYNGVFNTGSLHKGIKSQEDVERVLARGIISADGKTRRYNIDYSPNFDGVVIYSDDYYEHGEAGGKIDNRTGKPWGPYDYIEFAGDELNESVSEGEVIKGRFGQKFVPTLGRTVKTSRYERNPDIDIPMYDPVKHRVWHAGISELDNREPFDHFEVKASDIGVTTHIIGVAKDGRRISVSTTSSEELAQALVDAYNRGGFTDKDIEKVPLKESAKIRLSTDPDYFGAEVGDYQATGPVHEIMLNKLVGFEPDSKMEDPKSRANVEKITAAIRRGDNIPPILVRKYHDGYQIIDGHHRFCAYKLLKKLSIPAQIVPDEDIEEVGKKNQGKGKEK